MNLSDYTEYDAIGLAQLISSGQVSAHEVQLSSVEYGRHTTALDLYAAQRTCNFISRSVGAFFRNYDVLLTPTVAMSPPPLGYLNQNDPSLDPLGWLDRSSQLSPSPPSSTPLGSLP